MNTKWKPWIYEHFKDKRCEVIGIVLHSETRKKLVLYKALYKSEKYPKDQLWVHPESIFLETVEHNGQQILRFKLISLKDLIIS